MTSPFRGIRVARLIITLALITVVGCSHTPRFADAVRDLPPLPGIEASAAADEPAADLLGLDEAMRRFLVHYAPRDAHPQRRLTSLHEALRGAGTLGLQYDPFADGSAREVFHRGTANCLGYANLFVALAREAGLDARFQWLEVRPQWSHLGDRVARGLHVNVVVRLPDGNRYMVDIDPLQPGDVAGTHLLRDYQAAALHYNNLAVEAMEAGDMGLAWRESLRALRLAPDMAQLWVNVGVLYRHAEREDIAEEAWLRALELDSRERSAMNNLVLLYSRQGRDSERQRWEYALRQHRDSSPWYHASLAQHAGAQENWTAALVHYQRALKLLPDDSQLLKEAALVELRLGHNRRAEALLERALAAASLDSDVRALEGKLRVLQQARAQPPERGSTRM